MSEKSIVSFDNPEIENHYQKYLEDNDLIDGNNTIFSVNELDALYGDKMDFKKIHRELNIRLDTEIICIFKK